NEVIFERVEYDVDTAARKIIEAGLPEFLAYRLYEGY
ncbi:MAG: metallophosphoesterase, partial [Chloroflexi bacterium]